MPGVSQAVSHVASASTDVNAGSFFNSPRNTLSSTTGMVVAINENSNQVPTTPSLSLSAASNSTGLPFDEEAKLVYGVVISLRNMIKKISGRYVILSSISDDTTQNSSRDEQFVNYRTSGYKLHLFETLSGYKFIILSDPKTDSLRFVLRQIYVGPFLEYVVRNPLIKMDSRQQGIDNEYFKSSVDKLIRALSVFA